MKHQRGFTLIEMLVVVAIILIIAAITIPSMTAAKVHADEASAVASIRAINQAEVSYMAAYGGYAESLANLGGYFGPDIIGLFRTANGGFRGGFLAIGATLAISGTIALIVGRQSVMRRETAAVEP